MKRGPKQDEKVQTVGERATHTTLAAQIISGWRDPSKTTPKVSNKYTAEDYRDFAMAIHAYETPEKFYGDLLKAYNELNNDADRIKFIQNMTNFAKQTIDADVNLELNQAISENFTQFVKAAKSNSSDKVNAALTTAQSSVEEAKQVAVQRKENIEKRPEARGSDALALKQHQSQLLQEMTISSFNSKNFAKAVGALETSSNQITNKVALDILGQSNIEKAKERFDHYVQLARECIEGGDLHSAQAIYGGLNLHAVERLGLKYENDSKNREQFRKMFEKDRQYFKPENNWKAAGELMANLEKRGVKVIPLLNIVKRNFDTISNYKTKEESGKTDAEIVKLNGTFIAKIIDIQTVPTLQVESQFVSEIKRMPLYKQEAKDEALDMAGDALLGKKPPIAGGVIQLLEERNNQLIENERKEKEATQALEQPMDKAKKILGEIIELKNEKFDPNNVEKYIQKWQELIVAKNELEAVSKTFGLHSESGILQDVRGLLTRSENNLKSFEEKMEEHQITLPAELGNADKVIAELNKAVKGNDLERMGKAREQLDRAMRVLVEMYPNARAMVDNASEAVRNYEQKIKPPEQKTLHAEKEEAGGMEEVPLPKDPVIAAMMDVPLTSSPESSPQASPRKNSSDNIVPKKAAKILGVEGINDKAAKQLGLDLNALGGAADVVKTSPRSPRSPREVLGNLWTNVKAVFSPRADPNNSPVRRVSLAEIDLPPEETLPQGVQVKGDRIIEENNTKRPNAGMQELRAEAKAQEKAIEELKEAGIKRENNVVISALEKAYHPDERPKVRIRDNSVTILIKNEQDKTQLKEALQRAGVTAEVTNFGVSISREQVKALMIKPEGKKALVRELKQFKEEKKAIEELKAVNPLALLNSRLQEAADQFNAHQPTPTIAVQDVGGEARTRNKEKPEGSPLLLSPQGQRATSPPAEPGVEASIKAKQSFFEEFTRPKVSGFTSQDNSKKLK